MKQVKVKIFAIFTILLLSICNFGQKQSSKNPKNKKPGTTEIPEGWKKVDLQHFAFALPKKMKDQNAQGIETKIWEFADDTMSVEIEFAPYKIDFFEFEEDITSKSTKIIDGIRGKYLMGNRSKADSDQIENTESGNREYFEIVELEIRKGFYTRVMVYYKQPEQK